MTGKEIRRLVLEQSKRAEVGHIGSSLSVADVLAALYSGVLRVAEPEATNRDRFILGKGHAALALYAALHLRGWLSREVLDSYCADGSLLGVHPNRALPGVDFSTGSLGMALSWGAGSALAARLDGSDRHVFVLISDAELNEGAVWEALMFAGHHRLEGLTAIVDCNGQQALGHTPEVLGLPAFCEQASGFGWRVTEVDGHDDAELTTALMQSRDGPGPHLVHARTVFGKGVSFMEGRVEWHYLPMSAAQYERAMDEVEAT